VIDQHDPHAPWIPEGARPFMVGDRVRVRLSRECPFCQRDADGLLDHTGKVLTVHEDYPEYPGHHYRVVLDKMAIVNGVAIFGGLTSAIELELLDAP